MDCIFCKIVNGEIPSAKLFENAYCFSFLDINPAAKGHALVVPKEHFETLLDLNDENAIGLIKAVKRVAKGVVLATKADGYNIIMNNRKAAGQEVMHAHFHIIPRFENDALRISPSTKKYGDNELQEYKEKIMKNV
jgi:histidine triad (HIT) family protein